MLLFAGTSVSRSFSGVFEMRVLGLDLGDKTIGVAVSDPFGLTAQGITTISRSSLEKDVGLLKKICLDYGVEKIIIGMPKNMNGTVGPRGKTTLKFAGVLRDTLGLPVATWDERLSTVSAEKALIEGNVNRRKRKAVIDKMAAVVILQSYLDSKFDG